MKQPQQQLCINHCSQARNNECCNTCLLSTAVQRDAKTQAVLDSIDESTAKTDELTSSQLERSAMRTDLVLFFWVALVLVIAVMWAFGQSAPMKMCGGV